MNLIKKLFKHDPDGGGSGRGTALAKREGRGMSRGGEFDRFGRGFDKGFDKLWRDFERDPWSLVRDPWSAWSTVERMGEQLGTAATWPAVDVSEDEHAVTVRCDVPGLDAKDLDVQVSGNRLTVSGSRQEEWSDKDKKRGVRRHERYAGSFARTITLPSYVDASKVEAAYDKGTLTVTVPKVPGQGPKRVKVAAA